MGRLVRSVGLLAILAAFPFLTIAAQDVQAGSAKALVIGWAELSTAEAVEYRDVAVLVPRQLMAGLKFVEARYPSDDEFRSASMKSSLAAIESLRVAVADARKKRDIMALSVRDAAKRDSDIAGAEAAITKAEKALADAVAAPIAIPSAEEKNGEAGASIALAEWTGNAAGGLLPPVDDPAAACAINKIDILVYGSIRTVGAFVAVDITLYVAALAKNVWQGSDFGAPDGLDIVVAALVRPLAEAVLGKPFSLVTYKAYPPEANIVVDGKAIDESRHLFFEYGAHTVSASALGFDGDSSSFTATLGTDALVELTLTPADSIGFALSSDPPGASVHIDGESVGTAPAEIPGAAYPRVARLSMPGFDDIQMIIRPDSLLEDRTITMTPADGLSFDERYDAAKGRFYHSLGWFVASLPIPVLAGGLFQTYYATLTAAADGVESGAIDIETIAGIESSFYTTQTVFWSSAAVTAGLAINAIIRFALYIDSAR